MWKMEGMCQQKIRLRKVLVYFAAHRMQIHQQVACCICARQRSPFFQGIIQVKNTRQFFVFNFYKLRSFFRDPLTVRCNKGNRITNITYFFFCQQPSVLFADRAVVRYIFCKQDSHNARQRQRR